MDNFSSAGSLRPHRIFMKGPGRSFSPSFGVRHGFLADVERPLPAGVMGMRRSARVPASFCISLEEGWRRVAGDISQGGALVLLDRQMDRTHVEISIQLEGGQQSWRIDAQLVSCEERGQRFAHHLRFIRPEQAEGLDRAIQRSLAAGEPQLWTD